MPCKFASLRVQATQSFPLPASWIRQPDVQGPARAYVCCDTLLPELTGISDLHDLAVKVGRPMDSSDQRYPGAAGNLFVGEDSSCSRVCLPDRLVSTNLRYHEESYGLRCVCVWFSAETTSGACRTPQGDSSTP